MWMYWILREQHFTLKDAISIRKYEKGVSIRLQRGLKIEDKTFLIGRK